MSHGIPVTYVPARNTIFLSLALAWAEVLEAPTSSSASTRSITPAIRIAGRSTSRLIERMANLATKAGVEGSTRLKIHTPLIALSKAQIVTLARELACRSASRIVATIRDAGRPRPCGACDACLLRRKGFEEAGIEDR
jgi:7-cyano-7-deazaguanine synthase